MLRASLMVGLSAMALLPTRLISQESPPSSAPSLDSLVRCDSIIAASRVDSVPRGLYLVAWRADEGEPSLDRLAAVTNAIATLFELPRPFKLAVFEGPAQMSALRRRGADTAAALRAPTVLGVYRFTTTSTERFKNAQVLRASLVSGLDDAMVVAMQSASSIRGVVELPAGEDSIRFEVRISTDSLAGSIPVVRSFFPRMPVVDATALRDNPPAIVPEDVENEPWDDVVLRFVVRADGLPDDRTVEIMRASAFEFVHAALVALPKQRFVPARIHGCAIAQEVSYPFAFVKRSSE